MTKLSNTLSFSYRDKYEWWAGVELSRRAFLIFVLFTFPRNTVSYITHTPHLRSNTAAFIPPLSPHMPTLAITSWCLTLPSPLLTPHLSISPLPIQTLVILVLAGILTLFGHVHPYKHRLTNLSEVAVLANFIILLALRQTPYVIDEYFQFPSEEGEGGCGDHVPKGVATISWILLPLYYLPVLVFAVLVIAHIVLCGAPPLW